MEKTHRPWARILAAGLLVLPAGIAAGEGPPPDLPDLAGALVADEAPLDDLDNHACWSGWILHDNTVAAGAVSKWARSNWFFHYDDDVAVAYVLQPIIAGTHVQTTLTDADLYVYRYDSWNCTGSLVCRSIAGAGKPDKCIVDTGYWNVIEVRYYAGDNIGHADYTLLVAAA